MPRRTKSRLACGQCGGSSPTAPRMTVRPFGTFRRACSMTTPETGAAETRPGPLAGVRVIDIGWFLAGPVTATVLAEFGADVIKVERPGRGDALRHLGWSVNGDSLWWSVEARNKRSVTLDLSQPRGQALLGRLLEGADVLVENFTPGTLERWGLDTDSLAGRFPRLIVLRTSGFGQT